MNLKRVLAVSAIGGTLALGLAACGSTSTPTPASPSTAAATASAAPTVAPTASPSVAATPSDSPAPVLPEDTRSTDTSGTRLTVPSGGFFNIGEPAGVVAALKANPNGVDYKQEYDKSLVYPPMGQDIPTDLKVSDIVMPNAVAPDGTTMWKVADGATGTATIVVSYKNPKTGETVKYTAVIDIK